MWTTHERYILKRDENVFGKWTQSEHARVHQIQQAGNKPPIEPGLNLD